MKDWVTTELRRRGIALAVRDAAGVHHGLPDALVTITVRDPRAWWPLARGRIGQLAQAYVRGHIDLEGTPRAIMSVAGQLLRADPIAASPRKPWGRAGSHWRHRLATDRRHVQRHYDVSDDFYALWLDAARVYSCAYFRHDAMTLAEAQQAKLDLVCRKLRLRPGERLLDVGCGWGALVMFAARHYGVDATGITLSRHQHAHVQRLIDEAGLGGRVRVRLQDYRDLQGEPGFDKIASVGMFEHVGAARLPQYFRVLHRLLAPGGLLLNHGITAGGTGHDELGAGIGRFVERHIFPGGELVHVSAVQRVMAEAGFEVVDVENLRPHYARTLWAWSDALERNLEPARGFVGEAVVRAYRLYLAGSAFGFEQGWMAVHQILAAQGVVSLPLFRRESLYEGTMS